MSILIKAAMHGISGSGGEPTHDPVRPDCSSWSGTDTDRIWKAILSAEILKKGALRLESRQFSHTDSAPIDSLPFCTPTAARTISEAALMRQWWLLNEGLLLLRKTKQLLHPVALPVMLDQLKGQWPSTLPFLYVMGSTATWLCKKKSAWDWLLRILNVSDPIHIDHYQWLRVQDPVAANELLSQSWSDFNRISRKPYLMVMARRPHISDINLLQGISASRSGKERQQVLNMLLTIPSSIPSEMVANVGTEMVLQILRGKRISMVPEGLPFRWPDLTLFADYFTNPIYRLIASVPPLTLTERLEKKPHVLLESVLNSADSERLLQALVLASSTFKDPIWISLLNKYWYEHHPCEMTIAVDFGPVLSKATGAKFNEMVKRILEENAQPFEKLNFLCQYNDHYLDLENSRSICELIIEQLLGNMKHVEKSHSESWMTAGGRQLDPRIYPFFNTKWSEAEHYFLYLPKQLITLRNELYSRFQLYKLITGTQ